MKSHLLLILIAEGLWSAVAFAGGPKYTKPDVTVPQNWQSSIPWKQASPSDALPKNSWWTVFNDPVLDDLICYAYKQNLTLRQAGFRVMAARARSLRRNAAWRVSTTFTSST